MNGLKKINQVEKLYNKLLKDGETHPIEDIGETLRSMMTPLFKKNL